MSDKPSSKAAYFFEPKSPLVFRTGRPFDQAGDPVSLDFPLPSTLAGACRTAIGDAQKIDFAKDGEKLREIPVHGPLAGLISENGKTEPLFPKPADAVYMRKDEKGAEPEVLQLKPDESSQEDTWSDLADLADSLSPVGLPADEEVTGKPYKKGAQWWNEDHLVAWLQGEQLNNKPEDLGWSGPQQELRTHVQLEPETLSAATGQLFQTNNLSFAPGRLNKDENRHEGWTKEQYGLLAHLPDDDLKDQAKLFRRIGGEGRIAQVTRHPEGWPAIHDGLCRELENAQFIRLILATPALFKHGWRPDWLGSESLKGSPPCCSKITLQLKAFITPRWEPVSGWDLARNPQHKNTQEKKGPGAARAVRRMVPAGAVYWFEVIAGQEHLPELWLQPISDDKQDRKDGYGLTLPGIWKK